MEAVETVARVVELEGVLAAAGVGMPAGVATVGAEVVVKGTRSSRRRT